MHPCLSAGRFAEVVVPLGCNPGSSALFLSKSLLKKGQTALSPAVSYWRRKARWPWTEWSVPFFNKS